MLQTLTTPACKLCDGKTTPRYTLKSDGQPFDVFECERCQFHFIGYLDSIEPFDPGRPDISAESLSTGLEANRERIESNAALLRQHAPISGRVLDVGSGGGAFLTHVRSDYDCVGLELDPRYVAHSRALGMDVRTYPLEDPLWDADAGTFDAITLWDVIEHVNDPAAIVARALMLLKPGGILLMDTPSRDGAFYRFGQMTYAMTGGRRATTLGIQYSPTPWCHKQIFRQVDMRAMLNRAGFQGVGIERRFELSFPADYYVRYFVKSVALRKVLGPLALATFKVAPIHNKLIVVARK